ncbi:ABC transporter permease subunit [Faecalicatena contorta]|uniref:ABC transporter permease subunit n=1 Tax=Faecalicatena contorta TaxID=39482 RepID=UPI001F3A353F|nr:ABC transporter permease subunit [Faecalicatena contorta]MCF2555599.1 ABC transporter permease subunit [Faecalicatena contorta]
MLNKTLFRKELKSNYIMLLIFLGVLSMYSYMITLMFDPKLGDSLNTMAESMPELFAAFGMADAGTTLLEFVTNYLYGMLFIAFPGVFIILLSNRLVARYVDNGSMAYLLSIPKKRSSFAATQALFMGSLLLIMVVYVTSLILIVSEVTFPDELDIPGFLRLNVGLFGLFLFFGGICFFFSCFFNESRLCTGASSALVVYSILVQMISQVGDKFEKLKYATPLTLFDTKGLSNGASEAWIGCIILYLIGIIGFVAGIRIFRNKNLSI